MDVYNFAWDGTTIDSADLTHNELQQILTAAQNLEENDMEDNGKQFVEAPAIDELGYDKVDDKLAVPNRFVDVREVTNLVRYAQYQVGNLRAVITEDIAEGQAAASMLGRAARGLAGEVAELEKLQGGGQ